jgi:hypothetical protein
MKRISILLALVSVFILSNAQENNYEYLFKKDKNNKNLWKPYASLTFQHLVVKTNTMPGLELGFSLNNNFLVGFYGQGTVGNFSHEYNNEINHVLFGEGGILAGYSMEPNKTLHFGGTFKLGYMSMVADDEEIKLFNDFEPIAEDAGVVYHPELFSEINVSKYMKVKLGAGYSFYLLNNENIICNQSLDSWALNFGVVFSNFIK